MYTVKWSVLQYVIIRPCEYVPRLIARWRLNHHGSAVHRRHHRPGKGRPVRVWIMELQDRQGLHHLVRWYQYNVSDLRVLPLARRSCPTVGLRSMVCLSSTALRRKN